MCFLTRAEPFPFHYSITEYQKIIVWFTNLPVGMQVFEAMAPDLWNALPAHMRFADYTDFRKLAKGIYVHWGISVTCFISSLLLCSAHFVISLLCS